MQKQILVKTPLTENGRDPVIGDDGRQVYTESILLDTPGKHGARGILEDRNAGLPKSLKMIIEDYTPTGDPSTAPPKPTTIPLLDQLKIQAENESLKAQLEALKAKPTKPAKENATA